MSKRFGRNQKRALREAVARANTQVAEKEVAIFMQKAVLDTYRDNAEKQHEFLCVLATKVTRYAIAAGEPIPSGIRAIPGWMQVGLRTSELVSDCPSFSHVPISYKHVVQSEILDLLDVDAVRSLMKQEVHCIVQVGDKKFTYAISQHAFAT